MPQPSLIYWPRSGPEAENEEILLVPLTRSLRSSPQHNSYQHFLLLQKPLTSPGREDAGLKHLLMYSHAWGCCAG